MGPQASKEGRKKTDLGGLGENVGGDLVTEDVHDGPSRSDELDTLGLESVGEPGVLRGVSPARPHGIDALTDSDVDDDVDVGVVVLVASAGNLDVRVGCGRRGDVGMAPKQE